MRLPGSSVASRKRLFLMVSSFGTAVANTLALLLIAREMGPEILGALALLLSYVGLLFFVGDLGNNLAFSKLVDDGHDFNDCYSGFVLAKFKLTILLVIVSGAMMALYTLFLEPGGHTPIHPISMALMLGYFLLLNVAQIWVVGLAAKGRETRSKVFDALEALAKAVMIAGVVIIGLATGDQEAVFYLVIIYLLSATLGLMIIRDVGKRLRRTIPSDEIVLAYNRASGKLLPFVALGALAMNLDKVLLWLFTEPTESFETLGVYFGAQRITIFIGASSVAIQGLVAGSVSKHLHDGDKTSVSDTLRLLERYITLMVLPVTAFYILFSDEILQAFLGGSFTDAGLTVALLAGAGLFTALASPHVIYLLKDGRYRALAGASAAGLTTLLVTMLSLVPGQHDCLGPMDATALAMLLSSIVACIGYRISTYSALGCRPHPKILSHLLCTGVMVAVLRFLIWNFDIAVGWNWILVFALLGALLYGLPLYLVGEFLKRDFTKFKDLTREP